MTIKTREAFERGTRTFNTHYIKGIAEVLADDVIFEAAGGLHGKGKAACLEFFSSGLVALSDVHVGVRDVHILDDVAVEEGTFTGTHTGVLLGTIGNVHRPDVPSGSGTSKCSASGMASMSRST